MKFRHSWLFRHVCRKLPADYEGYGETPRERDGVWGADCSSGCRWAWWLTADMCPVGDWLICVNERSHRCGMLTFEHQGCFAFEGGPEPHMRRDTEAERAATMRGIERRRARLERGKP